MFDVPDLRTLYDQTYDDRQSKWREAAATDKALHVELFCASVLAPGARILEVGCGTGHVLASLAAKHPQAFFHGVEIGAARMHRDQRFSGLRNFEISGYEGGDLPFEDASFDIVYASHVLEHVLNERKFLKEMRRVTRNVVFLEVPCEHKLTATPKALQRSLDIGHINFYSPDTFAITLETSGLKVERLELYDFGSEMYRMMSPSSWRMKSFIRQAALKFFGIKANTLFTYHAAAACRVAPLVTIDQSYKTTS